MRARTDSKRRLVTRAAAVTLAAAWLGFVPNGASAGQRLEITSALWSPEKSELRIEGTSRDVDDVVLVRDAGTRKLLGSAAVRKDGIWMLKIRDPNVVPKRTRVECRGATGECEVTAATVAQQ